MLKDQLSFIAKWSTYGCNFIA